MSVTAFFGAVSIDNGYTGNLIDALIVKCPTLADWLDVLIPILPQRDCAAIGLRPPPHHEVIAGWYCQSLGTLLTYQEALLLVWGFTFTEMHRVLGREDSLSIDTVIDRVMHLKRISLAVEVLLAPRDHGFAWINLARDDWGGLSPKHWMLDGRLAEAERKLMEQLRNGR